MARGADPLVRAAVAICVLVLGVPAAAGRPVAVLAEPGVPFFMSDPSLSPEAAVATLRACGIEATPVGVEDMVRGGALRRDAFAALVMVHGNTFPKAALSAIERFRREGGGLVAFGVPFCHPCVPAGPVGWMLYSPPNVARDELQALSPPYSVKIVSSGRPQTWSGLGSGRVRASEGDRFEVSAWVRTQGELRRDDCVYVRFFGAGGRFLGQYGPTLPSNASDWTRVAGEVTAPADTVAADCLVAVFSAATVWVDDLSLGLAPSGSNLLRDPTLDGTVVGGCYDDLGHVGDWLGHDPLGVGMFRVETGADRVALSAPSGEELLGLSSAGELPWHGTTAYCTIDPDSFPAEDEVVGLVHLVREGTPAGWTTALVRHKCERFRGAVDAWVSTLAPPRPLADRLLAACAARVLFEMGELDEGGLRRAQAAADQFDLAADEPVELPPPGPLSDDVFPKPEYPEHELISVDLTALGPEDQLTITALQGLANRPRPRVYVRDEWEPDLEGLGHTFERLADPWQLVARFRDEVRGLAVYDPDLPATANLALTLCGLRGWLPVAPSQLGIPALAGFSVEADLRGRFETEAAAYEWGLRELRPECTDRVLCHEKQAEPLRPVAASIASTIADYVVQQRVFSWHLNKVPTAADLEVARRILASYPLNTPVIGHFGPEPNGAPDLGNEAEVVELTSRYGKLFVFLVSHNVSVHAGFPTPTLTQARPAAPALDPSRVYVAPYLSDGDSPTTFYQGRQRWADAARGTVPIAWSLGPLALEVYPVPMRWFYDHATPLDTFVSACSGAGYCYPRVYGSATTIGQGAALGAFLSLTDRVMRRADLDVCHVHHVAGIGPAELDRYASEVTCLRGILADYSRVVPGYTEANHLAGGRVPVFHALTSFMPPAEGTFGEMWAREIRGLTEGVERPGFVLFFGVLWFASPSDMADTARLLDPAVYQVVRPDHLAELYLRAASPR